MPKSQTSKPSKTSKTSKTSKPKTTKSTEAAPKSPKAPKAPKAVDSSKPLTAHAILGAVALRIGRPRSEVAAVLDGLIAEVKQAMAHGGPGVISLLGLMKLKRVAKPAVPARTAADPFNKGVMKDYPAKPAATKYRVVTLKGLRDLTVA